MNALLALLISLNVISSYESRQMTPDVAVEIAVGKNICTQEEAYDLLAKADNSSTTVDYTKYDRQEGGLDITEGYGGLDQSEDITDAKKEGYGGLDQSEDFTDVKKEGYGGLDQSEDITDEKKEGYGGLDQTEGVSEKEAAEQAAKLQAEEDERKRAEDEKAAADQGL